MPNPGLTGESLYGASTQYDPPRVAEILLSACGCASEELCRGTAARWNPALMACLWPIEAWPAMPPKKGIVFTRYLS